MKFPELTPSAVKKNLKLACCDRCNRAEWVEPYAQASFCDRCRTRRRMPTKQELEQFRQITLAAMKNAPPAPPAKTGG